MYIFQSFSRVKKPLFPSYLPRGISPNSNEKKECRSNLILLMYSILPQNSCRTNTSHALEAFKYLPVSKKHTQITSFALIIEAIRLRLAAAPLRTRRQTLGFRGLGINYLRSTRTKIIFNDGKNLRDTNFLVLTTLEMNHLFISVNRGKPAQRSWHSNLSRLEDSLHLCLIQEAPASGTITYMYIHYNDFHGQLLFKCFCHSQLKSQRLFSNL